MPGLLLQRHAGGHIPKTPTVHGGTQRRWFPKVSVAKAITMTSTLDDYIGRISADSIMSNGEPVPELRGIARLVSHTGFLVAVNVAIIASSVQMGVQAELGSNSEDILVLRILETIFTALFTLEMLLKLYVQRCMYFSDQWNFLDFAVAWVSIINAWIMPLLDFGGDSKLSVIKIFRLLRLLRIIKLTNAIPTLRMVVEGLISSMRALFWVVLLFLLVVYLFAIFCVEVIGRDGSSLYPGYNDTQAAITSSLTFLNYNNYEYFGTVSRAMSTLCSMSILAEWDSFRPVWEFQPWCTPVIAMLIFCTTFGIVNVIIGVIVEHTTASMNELAAQVEAEEKERHMLNIRHIAADLWKSNTDGDDNISRDEMRRAGLDPKFAKHFREMDLPKGFTFDDLFDMLNLDGKGGLSHSEFIGGMHRMIFGTDFQKTCLMMLGMGQIKHLHREVINEQRQYFDRQFACLREDVHVIAAEVRSFTQGSFTPPPPSAWKKTFGTSQEEPLSREMSSQLLLDGSASAYKALEEARAMSLDCANVSSQSQAHRALEEARCASLSGAGTASRSQDGLSSAHRALEDARGVSLTRIGGVVPAVNFMATEVVTEVDTVGVVVPPPLNVASDGDSGCMARSAAADVQEQAVSQEGAAAARGLPFANLACPMADTEERGNPSRGDCGWFFRSLK